MALEAWILEGGDPESMHKRIACAESIVEQMWKLKARWLKHAMTEGMDVLLARSAGYVEPVKPEDLGVTTVQEFKSSHATAFFSPKTRWHPNKGRFWKVTKGAHADRLALVICIGKAWLHVGLLPLRAGKLSDGVWMRIPRHSDTQPTLIRTPVPRSFGQAVGAQRRRGGIVSPRCPASSISSPACASIRP